MLKPSAHCQLSRVDLLFRSYSVFDGQSWIVGGGHREQQRNVVLVKFWKRKIEICPLECKIVQRYFHMVVHSGSLVHSRAKVANNTKIYLLVLSFLGWIRWYGKQKRDIFSCDILQTFPAFVYVLWTPKCDRGYTYTPTAPEGLPKNFQVQTFFWGLRECARTNFAPTLLPQIFPPSAEN